MKVLITGICGFVGNSLATWLSEHTDGMNVMGIDNLIRPGSELNRSRLRKLGVDVRHGDVRNASDYESLPEVDWVIDAAANPSVLAGIDGVTSTRQLMEHNLSGTLNMLEYCKRVRAGFVLLSTSRVYSIRGLAALPLKVNNAAFELDESLPLPEGVSRDGVRVEFSSAAPLSLYGSTKRASEVIALEFGESLGIPVWVNRCGVLAGAGQFGTAEQGIFSYWVHAYAGKRPLKYIGFAGQGHQVRDAFHPSDLARLIYKQITESGRVSERVYNVGGGPVNAMSLAQLTTWCKDRFGSHEVASDLTPRPFDIPWMVMDNTEISRQFNWKPEMEMHTILEEIAEHAKQFPDWFLRTGVVK
jgi:CDP-paratose 2-epimerase